jgi:2,4-dienoyl-CoA reductase-like NADH-dependent reductase (Old Yellow Enzyme family)
MRNRFIRSATYYALSDEEGIISDESVNLMRRLASSSVGLIVSGYAFVAKHGQVFPDMNGISTDDHIPPLKRMTDAVHQQGGKIAMQIVHGGSESRNAAKGDGKYLAVSVVGGLANKKQPPVEMTDEDIQEIIDAFGKAGRRVQEAGFDGVQIHGAHGYLVSQFLSPTRNKRSDRWGGSLQNRARFLVEVVRSIKKHVDADFPVMIKLGCRDYRADGTGLTNEEGAEVAKMITAEGICHIEVSHGIKERTANTAKDIEAYMLPDAKAVREKTNVPLALVGEMRNLSVMEGLVESGVCDQIALCRPLIRDPELIMKFTNGDAHCSECVSCRGCFNVDKSGKMHIYCSQLLG